MIGIDYDITEVQVVEYGVVRITFSDGLTGEVDLRGHLWGPVFSEARTTEGFSKVRVDGGTIAWPGGADLAPDTLYVKVSTGDWPDDLCEP